MIGCIYKISLHIHTYSGTRNTNPWLWVFVGMIEKRKETRYDFPPPAKLRNSDVCYRYNL